MRAARTGDPGAPEIGVYHHGRYPCVAPGCDKPGRTRGLCPMHYERWWRAVRLAHPVEVERYNASQRKVAP
jgi:hypothetical protein